MRMVGWFLWGQHSPPRFRWLAWSGEELPVFGAKETAEGYKREKSA